MKEGDIIRRLNSSGLPIGRYYMVKKVTSKSVYISNNITGKFKLTQPNRIKVYKKYVVQVSKEDYDFLKERYVITYHHPVSTAWDKIYDEQPEIIEFWCVGEIKRLYVKTEDIYRRIINGVPSIRIFFCERLFDYD